MVLNVGKGDLRGLSHRLPGPSKQDPPLSLGDWRKSRPAPLHTAQGGRKTRSRILEHCRSVPPLHPVTAVAGGRTKTQRRAVTPCLRVLGVGGGTGGSGRALRGFGWDSGRVQNYPVQSEVFGLQHLLAHSKYWMAPGEGSNPGNRKAPRL